MNIANAHAGEALREEGTAAVALMALTSGFLTGAAIQVDGGEHLV